MSLLHTLAPGPRFLRAVVWLPLATLLVTTCLPLGLGAYFLVAPLLPAFLYLLGALCTWYTYLTVLLPTVRRLVPAHWWPKLSLLQVAAPECLEDQLEHHRWWRSALQTLRWARAITLVRAALSLLCAIPIQWITPIAVVATICTNVIPVLAQLSYERLHQFRRPYIDPTILVVERRSGATTGPLAVLHFDGALQERLSSIVMRLLSSDPVQQESQLDRLTDSTSLLMSYVSAHVELSVSMPEAASEYHPGATHRRWVCTWPGGSKRLARSAGGACA